MIPKNFQRGPGFGVTCAGILLSFCLAVTPSISAEIPVKTADQSGVEQRERPGRERPDLPAFIEKDPEDISGLQQMPVPPPKPSLGVNPGPRVFVTAIRWRGNTVFSDDELSRIAGDYLNREITFEDLQNLRLRVTRHYIDHGYINSGAVIPDQEIVSGEIRMDIIEGKLAGIDVSGNDRLRKSYIQSRLMTGVGPPLNINDLQTQVRILHQNPLIDRVDAELRPGLRLGEAFLAAEVEEASPYVLGVEIGNRWSPRVGSTGGEMYAAHRNLTGWGDTLGVRYGMTQGLEDVLAYYNVPVSPRDTLLKFRYEHTDSYVVEDPFDDLDITGEADTVAVEIAHPFYRTPSRELTLALRGELRHSETTLLGQPFSFSPGVQDGESDVSVIRFIQEWLSRSRRQVFAVRSVFSVGLDVFGATIHDDDLPDGRFLAWLGQFQWAGLLPVLGGSQIVFRTDMQFCNQSVLPLEKFSVGGAYSVRGYPEDEFVRDDGVVTSLELRYPAFRLPIPGLSQTVEDGMVQLAAFTDWGWSENVDTATYGPRTIGSAGLGVRWDPSPGWHAQLYWGIPFKNLDYSSYDLQNDGIHFQVNCRVF